MLEFFIALKALKNQKNNENETDKNNISFFVPFFNEIK